MSKTMKGLIMRDYKSRIAGGTQEFPDALVMSIRGVKAVDTTKLRQNLSKKNIKITVVQNALARKTFENSNLAPLGEFLTGSSALAYGGQSVVEVAREVVSLIAKHPTIELRAAILDGVVFKGKKGVEELSKFPTRDEAIGNIVTLVVSPARSLMAQVKGPGAKVGGIVKAIEAKLEKGEAIAKVA